MDISTQLDKETQTPEELYGPKFLKLPEERINQLRSMCNKYNLRDQWGRQIEILRCTLKRYFWLGLQHTWWNNDAQCFQVGQQGGAVTSENMNDEAGVSMNDFNIYKPNGKIFTSVFAQNPASIRAEADRPKESDSIRAAAEAEKYFKVYDKFNPPQEAQIEIGRLLWNDGRIISITEGDGDTETTEFAGNLESKVPLLETNIKLWPYCKISKDHDVVAMKAKYSEVADKITAGGKSASPNDEIARMARVSTAESITQLSHDTLQYLVTEDRWWISPSAFYEMSEEDRLFFVGGVSSQNEDDEPVEPQEGIFPEGCKLTFIGETFCGAESVALLDHIGVMHAEPGEGQARNSLGDPHIPVQMEFNDAMNLTAELLKYCIPSLWADMDATEAQAIQKQLAEYGAIRFKKKPQGEPQENNFYAEPNIEAPAVLQPWIENLQGPLTQLVTLNQPAMFGANMEDQKTASAYQQALQQSMGVLTIIWIPFQNFMANIHEQAGRIAAKRDTKFSAKLYGKNNKEEVVDIDPLTMRGGFTCSAVSCQGFPESWQAKSTTMKGLMAAAPTNPVLAQTLQLPDNQELIRDSIGIPEFVIQGAESREKQLQEWAEMQKGEGPEVDQQATQQRDQQNQQMAQQAVSTVAPGQQAPPLPQLPPVMGSSIPVDDQTDDHVSEALEMFRILNSPDGQKLKRTTFPDGRKGLLIWQDGKLHMLAHLAAGMKKGLIFPPPLGGPPPMPMGKPGLGAPPPPGGPNATA